MFQLYNSSGLSVLVWFKQGAEAALELCVVVVKTGALRMRKCQSQQISRKSQILSSKFYDWFNGVGARSPRYKIVPRSPSLRPKNVPRAVSPGYMYVPSSGYIYVMRAASPITEVYQGLPALVTKMYLGLPALGTCMYPPQGTFM